MVVEVVVVEGTQVIGSLWVTTMGSKVGTAFWHLLLAVIAFKTSLFDGFWPFQMKTGHPSAKSINCSVY